MQVKFMQSDIKKIVAGKWGFYSVNSSYLKYEWSTAASDEPIILKSKKKGRFFNFNRNFFGLIDVTVASTEPMPDFVSN